MKKWILPTLLTGAAILFFSSLGQPKKEILKPPKPVTQTITYQDDEFLNDAIEHMQSNREQTKYTPSPEPQTQELDTPQDSIIPKAPTPEDTYTSQDFEAFLNYLNQTTPPSKVQSYSPLERMKTYTNRRFFQIKNLGTGIERAVFDEGYKTYLEKNEEEHSRGYVVKLFRDDKCVRTVEDRPDYFVITELGHFTEKTVMGTDYLKHIRENKGDYLEGFRVRVFESNELVGEAGG